MRKDLEKLIAITVKGVRLRAVYGPRDVKYVVRSHTQSKDSRTGLQPQVRSDSRVQDVPADLLQMWIGN